MPDRIGGGPDQAEGPRDRAEPAERIAGLLETLAGRERRISELSDEVHALRTALQSSETQIRSIQTIVNNLRRSAEKRLSAVIPYDPQSLRATARMATLFDSERASALQLLLRGSRAIRRSGGDARSRLSLRAHYFWRSPAKASALVAIARSGFFDVAYYLEQNPDVAEAQADPLLHYLQHGADHGRNPSLLFDTTFYLRSNPDVAAAGVNPLLHFVKHGRFEGRLPRPFTTPGTVLGHWSLPGAGAASTPSPRERAVRRVVYTAVVGGYDSLAPITVRPPDCDFIAFSDGPLKADGWQVRPLQYLHPDPTRTARFAKLHPHVFLSDYDTSLWVDGNIGISGDIAPVFDALASDSVIGIFEHPRRNCVYLEGDECILRGRDDPHVIRRQLEKYRAEGFPAIEGLWETNVLVRRHNDPACIALMQSWWREIELGSRRDQLSLPVVTRRHDMSITPLGAPDVSVRNHPAFTIGPHQSSSGPAKDAGWPAASRPTIVLDDVSITIGICVHNEIDHTRRCVESVLAARRPGDRMILVDDASEQATARALDAIAAAHPNVEVLRHAPNQGYTRSANVVLHAATGDWIVLINSDAVLPPKALLKLVAAGQSCPFLGIVGPLSNAASWQSVPMLLDAGGDPGINTRPRSLSLDDMDRLCEEFSSGIVPFVPMVNGFCFAVRRALIERIGVFDEDAFPVGYGEEDDFCLRAGDAGFFGGIATDTYVHHAKSASFTAERRQPLVAAGKAALLQKHGAERVDAATAMLRGHPELIRMRRRIEARLATIRSDELQHEDMAQR